MSHWFLHTSAGQQGPYSSNDLAGFLRDGQISHDWYVWRDGMPDWQRLGDTLDAIEIGPASSYAHSNSSEVGQSNLSVQPEVEQAQEDMYIPGRTYKWVRIAGFVTLALALLFIGLSVVFARSTQPLAGNIAIFTGGFAFVLLCFGVPRKTVWMTFDEIVRVEIRWLEIKSGLGGAAGALVDELLRPHYINVVTKSHFKNNARTSIAEMNLPLGKPVPVEFLALAKNIARTIGCPFNEEVKQWGR